MFSEQPVQPELQHNMHAPRQRDEQRYQDPAHPVAHALRAQVSAQHISCYQKKEFIEEKVKTKTKNTHETTLKTKKTVLRKENKKPRCAINQERKKNASFKKAWFLAFFFYTCV